MLTQARLKELIHYCPDSGVFTRLISSGSSKSGNPTGYIDSEGYVRVSVDRNKCGGHRLAWLYVNGIMPKDQIDHINGVRSDNRILNLREADQSVNSKNLKTPDNNKSGVIGVHWHKASEKWQAQISANGIKIHLGVFDDFEAACIARKGAEMDHGFHENHGRI